MNGSVSKTILETILAKLEALGHRCWPAVAEGSGIPIDTLIKIGRRYTTDPGISTVQRLVDYFHMKVR